MKWSCTFLTVLIALLIAPPLFAADKPQAGDIAVASDEKKPGSPVADRMGRSRFYLIYDAQGKFLKAMDNPNFGKGPRFGKGQPAIDSIDFNDKGVMTGGLSTPSREERDQTWKAFSDFFARNSIAVVVAGQFGYEIVRAMKAGGVTCVEFKGSVEDAVEKILQLQKAKEAKQ